MSSDPRGHLTFDSLFRGFSTQAEPVRPKLAGLAQRVRALVWPPACSQPHH